MDMPAPSVTVGVDDSPALRDQRGFETVRIRDHRIDIALQVQQQKLAVQLEAEREPAGRFNGEPAQLVGGTAKPKDLDGLRPWTWSPWSKQVVTGSSPRSVGHLGPPCWRAIRIQARSVTGVVARGVTRSASRAGHAAFGRFS
jgi:hypothetical protein